MCGWQRFIINHFLVDRPALGARGLDDELAVHWPPMTRGNAASARVRPVVWCRDCRHQAEPDPAEMARRYGAEMPVPEWHARLRCGQCGSRNVDMVVTGTERH